MTPNEATLAGALGAAVISALVSWRVAVYVVKRGPDYGQQLADLQSAMEKMSRTHEGMLAHQQKQSALEEERREALTWRPGRVEIKSDSVTRSNSLFVMADRHFRIEEISLLTRSGARVATIAAPSGTQGQLVIADEFLIPNNAIRDLVDPDPEYRQYQKTVGTLSYELSFQDHSRARFKIHFRAQQAFSNNVIWARLEA